MTSAAEPAGHCQAQSDHDRFAIVVAGNLQRDGEASYIVRFTSTAVSVFPALGFGSFRRNSGRIMLTLSSSQDDLNVDHLERMMTHELSTCPKRIWHLKGASAPF